MPALIALAPALSSMMSSNPDVAVKAGVVDPSTMSTGAMIGFGVGGLALLGVIGFVLVKVSK